MKKKKVHKSPMEYRIRYIMDGASNGSTQYYNVFHSSEAVDFLAHTFRKGHIHGKELKILAVEEYNRFTLSWDDRTEVALEHAQAPELQTRENISWLCSTI